MSKRKLILPTLFTPFIGEYHRSPRCRLDYLIPAPLSAAASSAAANSSALHLSHTAIILPVSSVSCGSSIIHSLPQFLHIYSFSIIPSLLGSITAPYRLGVIACLFLLKTCSPKAAELL